MKPSQPSDPHSTDDGSRYPERKAVESKSGAGDGGRREEHSTPATTPTPLPSGLVWDDRFRKILDSALDAVVTMDLNGNIVDWNSRAEEMFGWTSDEAIGHPMADLIVPERDREVHRQGLKHYMKTGEAPVLRERQELIALRRDGVEFAIELSVIAVSIGEEEVFTAFVRDLSQRNESAERVARMAALVDSSYDAIIGWDISGKIISWNRGALRVYGYTEEEAIGQTVHLTLPPNMKEEEPEILRSLQSGQRLEQFETVRRRKDNVVIPVSLTVSPIADANGTIIGSSTIERDITESRQHNVELKEAKDFAERANRTRGEFLANVSHELRTPMNAIIAMTQLALGEELSGDVRDYIQTANESAHSLLTLLNDILDFSKLESSKFTIDETPFNVRENVHETVKTLSTRAFEKGLELICDVAANVPDQVIGDPVRIRQVLTNLVSNAIKFTSQGEVTVMVKAVKTLHQQCRLRFSVRDTGVGITARDQERILEPFTQIDASATRQHGGTGLGLAICNELLGLMGSKLTIKSEPGTGSIFTFVLSLDLAPGELARSPQIAPQGIQGMPVLVVDDNETNRRTIADTLSAWSMNPDKASNAEQALELLENAKQSDRSYELVIADAIMPGMDGYELSQEIVERSDAPPPGVILMVSRADRSEFKQREQEAIVAGFLQKPVSQSELFNAILRAKGDQLALPEDVPAGIAHMPPAAPLSVLLAEDTPANQKVVTAILEKRGHHVTIAQNGREAVELSRKHAFDVILMDVQMPIMDGLQATAAIRDREGESDDPMPIIAMTAHAMRGDREKCLTAGMDAYLSKPIEVSELIETVEAVSQGEHHAHNLSGSPKSIAPSSNDAPINLAETMDRLAGDRELFLEFIGYFKEDTPQLLGVLGKAIAESDAPSARRAAHSLKGLSANFGATRCVEIAQTVEEQAEAEQFGDAAAMLPELEQEIQRVREALMKES